jgi:hypothetical protein
MKRARHLVRDRKLTHKAFAVLDTIVFACRQPSQDRAAVSYTKLCRLAAVSRPTAVAAVKQLVALRLLAKEKRGVLVVWGQGWAWRQIANVYVLICELSPRPVYQKLELKRGRQERAQAWRDAAPVSGCADAVESLANLRARRELALGLACRR